MTRKKGLDAHERGDYVTALKEWRPLAERGDANAQSNLGVMYDKGQGVPQDDKTAVKWYTLAAEQGNALAQYNLGVMYANGPCPRKYGCDFCFWDSFSGESGEVVHPCC